MLCHALCLRVYNCKTCVFAISVCAIQAWSLTSLPILQVVSDDSYVNEVQSSGRLSFFLAQSLSQITSLSILSQHLSFCSYCTPSSPSFYPSIFPHSVTPFHLSSFSIHTLYCFPCLSPTSCLPRIPPPPCLPLLSTMSLSGGGAGGGGAHHSLC